jgi:hypothetical protein
MITRRQALELSLMSLAPAVAAAATDPAADRTPPPDVGRKFDSRGRVLPFPGNTLLCHLPQQGSGSEAFGALLDVYRRLRYYGFAERLAPVPPSSYHMTLFSIATDSGRRSGSWPGGLAKDVPLERCHRHVDAILRKFPLDTALPLRMRVEEGAPAAPRGPIQIPLVPADAAEEAKMRRLRDRLAIALRLRTADHDDYRFHITLAYLIEWFTPDQEAELATVFGQWTDQLRAAAPIIELGAPEFCTFDDMFAFHRRFYLL